VRDALRDGEQSVREVRGLEQFERARLNGRGMRPLRRVERLVHDTERNVEAR